MTRLSFVLLTLLSVSDCISRWNPRSSWWASQSRQDVSSQWQVRQRFLLDLLLQVHKPLLQQELIEMGRNLNASPDDYLPVSVSWIYSLMILKLFDFF